MEESREGCAGVLQSSLLTLGEEPCNVVNVASRLGSDTEYRDGTSRVASSLGSDTEYRDETGALKPLSLLSARDNFSSACWRLRPAEECEGEHLRDRGDTERMACQGRGGETLGIRSINY